MRVTSLLMLAVLASAGCAHTQQPPERKAYVISDDSSGVGGSGGYDCAEEQIKCFDRCWNRAPHLRPSKGALASTMNIVPRSAEKNTWSVLRNRSN